MIYDHLVRRDGVNVPGGRIQTLQQTGIMSDPRLLSLFKQARS